MTLTLPKITRILWQCRAGLILVVLCVVFVAFCRFSLWFILPTAIVFTVGSVFVLFFMPLWFKFYKLEVDKNYLCITKGVIFKTVVIIPNLRIAFAKTFTTPVMSCFKLNCVILKVTRGRIFIPEINFQKANTLIEMMQNE